MKAKLTRFRVQNFRSIDDSGWITTDDTNCLVGTNEAGKTNLLLALWKLNPANGEPIKPLEDYPRSKFSDYEKTNGEEIFIQAEFEFNQEITSQLADITKNPINQVEKITFSRKYNLEFSFEFENKKIILDDFEEARKIVYDNIPAFVYYSDYGNLDAEIYLPHVIENLNRNDLGEKERSKSRSLKVLFDFVNLSATEILELGKEAYPKEIVTLIYHNHHNNHHQQPQTKTEIRNPEHEDIEEIRGNKKRREILLQAASTKLTKKFKEWWKQGDYRFRLQADGNYFRIWVSDDRRPDEIELESRSRGLQWFFSFFLVFLVESTDQHSECILLLDIIPKSRTCP